MGVEVANYINQLDKLAPVGSETIAEGDDHIRVVKTAVVQSFPNVGGAVTPTHTELNYVDGVTSAIQAQLDLKAPIASVLAPTYATTATAAGTTTLVAASAQQQYFTGTTTQTVAMPVTSTLVLGQWWHIVNNSTGAVTVQSSGGNTIVVIAPGTWAILTCVLLSGTGTASWNAIFEGAVVASGKKLTWNNTVTVNGTDGTTMTLPTTSATLARTDAANTFTGVQAMSNGISLGGGTTLANYLEGTWTPVIGGSTSESGQSYALQVGTYTRIGNRYLVSGVVQLSTAGTINGTYMYLKGFPATPSVASGMIAAVGLTPNGTLGANWIDIPRAYHATGTSFYGYGRKAATAASVLDLVAPADIGNSTSFIISGQYNV